LGNIACDHCALEFDEKVMIKENIHGDDKYFCCNGCQGVYHLLGAEGLDEFYKKASGTKLSQPKELNDDLAKFDFDGFKKKFIKQKDGLFEVSLIVEGIHCSACVWLNEKVLHKTEGIIEAQINYTNHKAKIVWDPNVLKLSDIILKIRSIGYNAYPYDASIQEERSNRIRKDYYIRLLVGVFSSMNIMWIAIALYSGYFSGISDENKKVLHVAEFILATPALFYTGWVYFKGAYYGLKNRFINMDFLVATGATLAYVYSIYAMISGHGEVYFDSVTMIITFVFVGKYLEVLSKKKAVDTLDALTSTLPSELVVIRDDEKVVVGIEEIEIGDIIEIKPGDKVVIDGKSISGEGAFDESSLSGESRPIYKKVGDDIISGTISLDSVIRYRATKEFENSTLSSIVSLLENSLTKKPKIEKLANQISGYFSVTILLIAVATFIGWYYYGGNFERALIVAISVIVIACPCALGVATPVATLMGLSVGAKRGIVFREASYLESMSKADVLLLDKTGTITQGRPDVVGYEEYNEYDKNILYSLALSSTHPISKAIVKYLEKNYEDIKEYKLENIKNIEARGVSAVYAGKQILGGNVKLLDENSIKIEKSSDFTMYAFAIDGKLCSIFRLDDKLKPDAKDVIGKFKKEGIEVVMLTGDNEKVASKISKEVGIEKFYHSLFPKQKAQKIDEYHERKKVVIMAGDGINDALALSKSDIAIAMGSGADISVNVSDVVLLDDKMSSLWESYKLSKKTFTNVKQNLFISLLYNLITIPLAVAGYVIPLIAALSMSLSSLIVVANALRIKWGFGKNG
jgi:Cu+-exporting ATPase